MYNRKRPHTTEPKCPLQRSGARHHVPAGVYCPQIIALFTPLAESSRGNVSFFHQELRCPIALKPGCKLFDS